MKNTCNRNNTHHGQWPVDVSKWLGDPKNKIFDILVRMGDAINALVAVKGYSVLESVEMLPEDPTEEEKTRCWLIDGNIYFYVQEGGDARDGRYLNFGTLKGDKGNAFTFADFTPEQLEMLKGEDGRDMLWDSLTYEQKERIEHAIAAIVVSSGQVIKAIDERLESVISVNTFVGMFATADDAVKYWVKIGMPSGRLFAIGEVDAADAYCIAEGKELWSDRYDGVLPQDMLVLGEFANKQKASEAWTARNMTVPATAKIEGVDYYIMADYQDALFGTKINNDPINLTDIDAFQSRIADLEDELQMLKDKEVVLSKEEYDALDEAGLVDPTKDYYIYEEQ